MLWFFGFLVCGQSLKAAAAERNSDFVGAPDWLIVNFDACMDAPQPHTHANCAPIFMATAPKNAAPAPMHAKNALTNGKNALINAKYEGITAKNEGLNAEPGGIALENTPINRAIAPKDPAN